MKLVLRSCSGVDRKHFLYFLLFLAIFFSPLSLEASTDELRDSRLMVLAARKFIDLDKNANGVLDFNERSAIINSEARLVFDRLDQNKDALLTRLEFIKGVEGKFFPASTALSRIFSSFQRRFSLTSESEFSSRKIADVLGPSNGDVLFKNFDFNADGQFSLFEGVLIEIFLISALREREISSGNDARLFPESLHLEILTAKKVLCLLLDADFDGKISEDETGSPSAGSKRELMRELNEAYSSSGLNLMIAEEATPQKSEVASMAVSLSKTEGRSSTVSASDISNAASQSQDISRVKSSSAGSVPSAASRIESSGVPAPQRTNPKKLDFLFPTPRKKNAPTKQAPEAEWRYTIEKILW
ncbi:MAG: EF-hand domain-containing protein [Candidatus Ozemobacteraceae bacterium]